MNKIYNNEKEYQRVKEIINFIKSLDKNKVLKEIEQARELLKRLKERN